MGKEHCQCSFPIISYIQSNDADCALSQPTKGLSECVRCKALGFKAKGVYFCVLD